jgi:dienelactone hydrolase
VHNPAHISSLVAPFVEKVKQEMPSGTKLYALGHCFGGKHALKLAQETGITAVIAMHPVRKKTSSTRIITDIAHTVLSGALGLQGSQLSSLCWMCWQVILKIWQH